MARVIDVEVDNDRIKIDFPYERELVQVVRTLPDRSFDNRSKCWFVPLKHLEYVIERLDGYHFKFSPRLRKFRSQRQNGADGPARPATPKVPEGTWTVSRLNHAAQAALKKRFDDTVWVVGELQDFNKNRTSRYPTYFFELVERPYEGATEVAKIKAVLFERHRAKIAEKLRECDIELSDGVAVRLGGQIDLYAKNGRYQLRVEDIDPAYTAGEIELNRERVFRALEKKGIESNNLDKPWPVCPMRIGLITSFESDAYNDFIYQLRESSLGCEVTVHDANVQGSNTEPSVLRALEYFRRRADQFDVVAIVRGGGSRSDLAHFDTEKIGEAICGHPLKVVCGVGHQRDTCLLDMIAESTKTPTAAAARIIDQIRGFVDDLEETYRGIADAATKRVDGQRRRLVRAGTRLERQVMRRLADSRRRHDRLADAVVTGVDSAIQRRRRNVDRLQQRLEQASGRGLEERHRRLDLARRDLSMTRLRRRLQRRRRRLERLIDRLRKSTTRDTEQARRQIDHLQQRLQLLDPHTILERGFALVSDDDGIVRSRDEIEVGHDFNVMFGDGVLQARRIEDGERSSPEETEETEQTAAESAEPLKQPQGE